MSARARGLAGAALRAWSFLVAVALSVAGTVGPFPPAPIALALTSSALSFNGTSDYVQVPDSASLRVSANVTVEAWVKPTSLVTGLNGVVSKPGYALALQPMGENGFAVVLLVTSGSTTYRATTAPAGPLGLGQWYHLAGTFDGDALHVFVNGNELGSLAQTGTIDPSATPLRVGMLDGSSIRFAGEIDEVRVSDVVRYTATFTAPLGPFVPDIHTRGLWHFDEGSGTTTADASGNANTGMFIGGPGWATDSPVGGVSVAPLITGVATTTVESGTATITWTTDHAADSQVSYGPTTAYGSRSMQDHALATAHTVKLDGLRSRTLYDYQVSSSDAFGNRVASANFSFTTTDTSLAAARLGEWSAARNWPEVAVHSALLYTGDVLAWDAWESPGTPSVRLWHPATETFTSVPNQTSQIFCAGQVSLADGRLLVIGGHNGMETGTVDTNLFDPATSSWSAAPRMALARWYPSATELPDGRVVAFSGEISPGVFANQPEIYTPSTNSWSSVAVDTTDFRTDAYPLSFQLPNGKFFSLAPSLGISRYLDVAAQTYTTALADTTTALNGSAVMYRPGKILYTGGGHPRTSVRSETTAEVVDLTQINPAWRPTTSMTMARTFHNMLVLPDGKVLAVGGGDRVDGVGGGTSQLAAETWDPATENWTTLAAERDQRQYHSTALLLPDGRVLSAGGGRFGTNPDYYSAEIYAPPYLFKGPRPTITGAAGAASYGQGLSIATPDASNITSVVLTGLGSVTHTLDMNQRYVELTFTRKTFGLVAVAPPNANVTPPGYYLLWLVNSSGVPSVSKMVKIGGESMTNQPVVVSAARPAAGDTVSGPAVQVSAVAASSVGIGQVQAYLDDQPLGGALTRAPYMLSWDTTRAPNGPHRLLFRTTDRYGVLATSPPVDVNVMNIGPPVVSRLGAAEVTPTGAVITWTTDEATTGVLQFGTSVGFGSHQASDAPPSVSHAETLSSLAPDTPYFCAVVSTNAIGGASVSSMLTFRTLPPPANGGGIPPGNPSGPPPGRSTGSGASGSGAGRPRGEAAVVAPGPLANALDGSPPVIAAPPVDGAGASATVPLAASATLTLGLDSPRVELSFGPGTGPLTGGLLGAARHVLTPPPTGFQFGGQPFTVSLAELTSGQPITDLTVPLSLRLSLTAADLAAAENDHSRLHLARWTATAWEALPCTTDATTTMLDCTSPRTGLFTLLVAPPTIAPLDFDINGGHFYKQANGLSGSGASGFAVVDDDQAPMWSEMARLGGVERLGYPISARFIFRGFLTQGFQKLVLQWRPELGRVVPVNVFDELSQRGSDPWLATSRQTPYPADTSADAGLGWDQVVARHAALLDAYPALRAAFDASPDTLEALGLPLAVQDYGALVTVRLQRATLQLWQTDTPWAAAGTIVVGNGGDVAREAGLWPAEATLASPS